MKNYLTWTLFLILPCMLVTSRPLQPGAGDAGGAALADPSPPPGQVISVRITSSVAVGRGKNKHSKPHEHKHLSPTTEAYSASVTENTPTVEKSTSHKEPDPTTTLPPQLNGANIEYIKQLHSKKEARGLQNFERVHTFPSYIENQYNDTLDSIAESSLKSVLEVESKSEENIENVPLARSVSLTPSSKNYIQGPPPHRQLSERGNNPRLTTVNFNILHDNKKVTDSYSVPTDTYVSSERIPSGAAKFYKESPSYYNEPAKVYSQPAQVYSEPAKYYSEPAKVYSEPAKIYSEPAKVYSEPAKIYSEPAKFYSEPASLHLPGGPQSYTSWQHPVPSPTVTTTVISTTPITTVALPPMLPSTHRVAENQPEKNYEVDEKISVLTDGRSHGVQESSTESCKQENCKVGYVVEGRQYRKYRVEERTSDGFIVGEYGVVRNEDGALRGVRYTADGDASPRLIYDALMKFLQLK